MTKLIPAEKLEALPRYDLHEESELNDDGTRGGFIGDCINGEYVKHADLRALIDSEPESVEPVAWLKEWEYDMQDMKRVDLQESSEPWLNHLNVKVTPLYTAPQDNLIAEKQAEIERVTEQRDRLLDEIKKVRQTLEDENNDSLSAITDTIWMQEGNETLFDYMDALIAEIEAKNEHSMV